MRPLALGLLLALACRGPLEVRAVGDDLPAWALTPDLAERVTLAAEAAAVAWGGSPSDLDGYEVTITSEWIRGDRYVMGTACSRFDFLLFHVGGDVVVRAIGPCVEATALAHEVGHVVIGDGDHRDRRWRDLAFWDRMAAAMLEVIPAEDAECRDLLAGGWMGIFH